VNDDPSILIFSSTPGVAAARLGGLAHEIADPYDALLEIHRRPWRAVVLTATAHEFDGLCRAARRLVGGGSLFALCPPSEEFHVRRLQGEPLDDYFLMPLSASDIARIRAVACEPTDVPLPNFATAKEQPDTRLLSELLSATTNTPILENKIAEILGECLGIHVAWATAAPVAARPLLQINGPGQRTLFTRDAIGMLTPEGERLISTIHQLLPALFAAARRTENLHALSITDHLTGAYNRRYFYERTDEILARADADFRASLLLFDIDNFKRYNDTYGHAVGDEILREIAKLMKQTSRTHDIIARIGGDEFAMLFWDCEPRDPGSRPLEDVYKLADRFRRRVQGHEFSALGKDARGTLTVSGGLATFPAQGRNCRELLRSADKALKEVKRIGKNAIKLFG